MADREAHLEFPPNPGYYSVIQTSLPLRISIVGLLLVIAGLLLWSVLNAYLETPQDFDTSQALLGLFLAAVPFVFIAYIWLSRPFLVKDRMVHLMRAVTLSSGRRTRLIPLSDISTATLISDSQDRLQLWVILNDGTRFRMVTMVREEDKEFVGRFAEHFSDA